MSKLPMQDLKNWLDEMPGRRSVRLYFWVSGIDIEFSQLDVNLDKLTWRFSWDEMLSCNLDLFAMKLNEFMDKMRAARERGLDDPAPPG